MDVRHEYFRRIQALHKEIIRLQIAKSHDVELDSVHRIRRLSLELTEFIAQYGGQLFGDDFALAAWEAEVERDADEADGDTPSQ